MRHIVDEARKEDCRNGTNSNKDSVPPAHEPNRDKGKSGKSWRPKKNNSEKPVSKSGSGWEKPSTGTKHKAVTCLNTECGGSHLVKECPNTSEELRKKLLTEFYEQRKNAKRQKKGPDGSVNALSGSAKENSSLFEVKFSGGVHSVALADQGSDVSILPPKVVESMKSGMLGLKISRLLSTHLYSTADENASPLPCSNKAVADIHITYSSACEGSNNSANHVAHL